MDTVEKLPISRKKRWFAVLAVLAVCMILLAIVIKSILPALLSLLLTLILVLPCISAIRERKEHRIH